MATFAQALSRATGTEIDVESLWSVLMFCGIGLLATLLLFQTGGLDMSVAFL
jgi:hypothetical protein